MAAPSVCYKCSSYTENKYTPIKIPRNKNKSYSEVQWELYLSFMYKTTNVWKASYRKESSFTTRCSGHTDYIDLPQLNITVVSK
jgi:hypothetical protein